MTENPADIAALAAGVALMAAGTGGEAVGFALDASIVGAPVGVVVNVASAEVIAAGAILAMAGTGDIAHHAATDDAVSTEAPGGDPAAGDLMPDDLAGRTAGEIRDLARRRGYEPHGQSDPVRQADVRHLG